MPKACKTDVAPAIRSRTRRFFLTLASHECQHKDGTRVPYSATVGRLPAPGGHDASSRARPGSPWDLTIPKGCLPAPACGVLCPGPGFGCLPMFRLPGEHNDSMRAGSQQPAAWHFSQHRSGTDRASWTRPRQTRDPPSRRRSPATLGVGTDVPSQAGDEPSMRACGVAGISSRAFISRMVNSGIALALLPLPMEEWGEGMCCPGVEATRRIDRQLGRSAEIAREVRARQVWSRFLGRC